MRLARFRKRMRNRIRRFRSGSDGAAGDKQAADKKFAACDKAKALNAMAGSPDAVRIPHSRRRSTASRRLAHGLRGLPKTMREKRNVRYASS